MTFVQVVPVENSATPSGATLRNRANFAELSKLRSGVGAPASIGVRRDPARRSEARTVLPLLDHDVTALISECVYRRPAFALVEGVELLEAVVALRDAIPELPIIVDMHNVESVLREEIDRARLPRVLRPLMPILSRRRLAACRSADRKVASMATQIWVCSEDDRERLLAIVGSTPVRIVPNPIPRWAEMATPAHDAGTGTGKEVLFVGHLGYRPNVAAVQLLVKDIMPRLRALIPTATLHVCGRQPRRGLARMVASHGHALSADVDDLLPIYRSANVAAIPLHVGGGSRLKILEAMATACPIVASEKAVEGLTLTAGVHYRPATSADEFARELAAVLRSAKQGRLQGLRSREWVISHYGQARRSALIHDALSAAAL